MPEKAAQKELGKKPVPSKKPKPQQEVVVQIPLSELHPFPDHPFQVREDGKRTIITRAEQSYGRVPFAGLCRSIISVYVPGAGLPGARASAFPAPHGSEICPDRAAYSAPAIDTHKAQCRWPWPFPPANTQWHWIPLP